MARNAKQTVDYFPHDCDASQRNTLIKLEQKYGDSGYSFWFKMLEFLGKTPGHVIDYNNKILWDDFLIYVKKDDDFCLGILGILAYRNAIDRDLWQQKRLIWSQNYVDGIADAYRRRIHLLPHKPDLCMYNDGRNEINEDRNSISDGINGESKGKERKEEERERKEEPIPPSATPEEKKTETVRIHFAADEYFEIPKDQYEYCLTHAKGNKKNTEFVLRKIYGWRKDNLKPLNELWNYKFVKWYDDAAKENKLDVSQTKKRQKCQRCNQLGYDVRFRELIVDGKPFAGDLCDTCFMIGKRKTEEAQACQ